MKIIFSIFSMSKVFFLDFLDQVTFKSKFKIFLSADAIAQLLDALFDVPNDAVSEYQAIETIRG